jgi:hypothetical protein
MRRCLKRRQLKNGHVAGSAHERRHLCTELGAVRGFKRRSVRTDLAASNDSGNR